MMKLMFSLFFHKPMYVIEYRWRIENEKTLWVIYKKFNNSKERDVILEKVRKKENDFSFIEYKSLDI